MTEVPHLRRLFIDSQLQYIDWGFIEDLPNLEVLYVNFYRQPTVSINLKNNKHLEYIGFTTGILDIFPKLYSVPNSLKYLNLEGNNITSLPEDFDKFNHATVILSINPFEKDSTTPGNVTIEFAPFGFGHNYYIPALDDTIIVSDLSHLNKNRFYSLDH